MDGEARIAYGDRVVISHKHDAIHQIIFPVEPKKFTLINYLKRPEVKNILGRKDVLQSLQFYVQQISFKRCGTIEEHILFSVCNNF